MDRRQGLRQSFDTFGPLGPWLVTRDEVPNPQDLRIWLSVNGQIRQDSDLSAQIWSVPEGIAILSRHYELAAGDIIMTGTPEGIGLVEKGDVLEVGIEGLGEIEVVVT